MCRVKLMLLSVVCVSAIVAGLAPTASAKISFEWLVGESSLATGEERTFDFTGDSKTFDLSETFPGGGKILLLSSKLSVEHGLIFGGRPGTDEETIVFENVTVDQPGGCVVESLPNPTVGTVRTRLLKSEIVEGNNGEALILFAPKTEGEAFISLLFINKPPNGACSLNEASGFDVTGDLLGLPLPRGVEVLRQNLVFPAVTNEFFLAAGGGVEKAGLGLAGSPFIFKGLTLFLLTSDAVFGPF